MRSSWAGVAALALAAAVIGEIGGYEQGGDYPWESFSPYYGWAILRLFVQAQLR